jgi:fermentation-respiration switch protein FrsA (DUF1100 family)
MPEKVSFRSKGLNCSGLLYVPRDYQGRRAPAIVMAHGLSAVKEQSLPEYAAKFVDAGFVTLVFDYRFFGESDGEPRCQLFPLEMVEDYRNAITWISDQPCVDPARVGIWGTSFSGGYVLYVGAFDRRVKAVVAQVPAVGSPISRYGRSPERWERDSRAMIADRVHRYRTGTIEYVKVVAAPGETCIIPGQSAYDFFVGSQASAPNWRNQLTRESLEKMREFDNITSIGLISPTPLLILAAERDELISIETLNSVFEKAGEPKSLATLPITHFEVYREPWLSKAAEAAAGWFKKHLQSS